MYCYPRYMFTNGSRDILTVLTQVLDLLNVHWTQTTPRVMSTARADDVVNLGSFVGPES